MCSAELPHFLCSSLIQALFPQELDIPLPACFFPDTHTHFSTTWSFLLPTACPPTHQYPTAPVAPKAGLCQRIQCWEGFRSCWATPSCRALPGKARCIFCWIRPTSILPRRTTLPRPRPGARAARLELLAAAPSFGRTSPHRCLPGTKSATVQTHSFGVGLKFPRAHSYGL